MKRTRLALKGSATDVLVPDTTTNFRGLVESMPCQDRAVFTVQERLKLYKTGVFNVKANQCGHLHRNLKHVLGQRSGGYGYSLGYGVLSCVLPFTRQFRLWMAFDWFSGSVYVRSLVTEFAYSTNDSCAIDVDGFVCISLLLP